jgi:cytosine/uracil/thiamine/allantoin permease
MPKEIIELNEDVSASPLYSEDLAPVPPSKRTWTQWDLAAAWVGMAVCIPTYLLASYMIKDGMTWLETLFVIFLGNLIITVPMVLNGHAGVKYGIPFPVVGRAAFGTKGIHIASTVRGIVACGWFGIQTWVGGLAIYSIWNALTGNADPGTLDFAKFVAFGISWLLNFYFIWNGTESIKWLEEYSAPILIAIGIALIAWGAYQAKGFGIVLRQSHQLAKQTAYFSEDNGMSFLNLSPVTDRNGQPKANELRLRPPGGAEGEWGPMPESGQLQVSVAAKEGYAVQFRDTRTNPEKTSSWITVAPQAKPPLAGLPRVWRYLMWLTVMVGFWATMAISIADITRYTDSQRSQVRGQFIGLPGTMALYSFVGIFVTCAALINFSDVLAAEDAPWDPVSLLARFQSPVVVIIAQIFMIIATLSTNIAANVIAPANAFSNLAPKRISFRTGGIITAIIGIIICPWWLMDEISGLLILVSSFLGPVLGILVCDYFVINKKELKLDELFKTNGVYAFGNGFNNAALIALVAGVAVALIGYFVPSLSFLYTLSWFTGFGVAFAVYALLMKKV